MISKKQAISLINEISSAISEEREIPVVALTKVFDYVIDGERVLLSQKEVMRMYGVSQSLITEWFNRGLKKTKCGGSKIRITDLEEFIESGKA